tara:strand:+ start:86 stop:1522 length:1437 start_codon:yes stop_codon:yes gene_type:complete
MSEYNSRNRPLHTYVNSAEKAIKLFQYNNQKTKEYFPSYVKYPKKLYRKIPKTWEPQTNQWKDLLVAAENQGSCGSCWAYCVTNTLTDRYNIWSNKKVIQGNLSPFLILTCNLFATFFKTESIVKNVDYETWNKETGCYGNILLASILYIYCFGIPTNQCFPYDIEDLRKFKQEQTNFSFNQPSNANIKLYNTTFNLKDFKASVSITPSCSYSTKLQRIPFQICQNFIDIDEAKIYGSNVQNFSITHFYEILPDEKQIQLDILSNGPVVSAFLIYDDFYSFDSKTEIYLHKPSPGSLPLGGHAVEIVGWGEENGIKYWWIKNTWGVSYGINGYFKFFRGKNMCNIEENVHGFFPDMYIDYQNFDLIRKVNKNIRKKKYLYDKENHTLPKVIHQVLSFILDNTHRQKGELDIEKNIESYFKKFGMFGYSIYSRVSLHYINYTNNYLGYFSGIDLPFQSNFIQENLSQKPYFKTLYAQSI